MDAKFKADERYLRLYYINILPQMRRTFDKIGELADSILRNGLIHPITVAELTREEAQKYLEIINQINNTHVSIEDLISINNR